MGKPLLFLLTENYAVHIKKDNTQKEQKNTKKSKESSSLLHTHSKEWETRLGTQKFWGYFEAIFEGYRKGIVGL